MRFRENPEEIDDEGGEDQLCNISDLHCSIERSTSAFYRVKPLFEVIFLPVSTIAVKSQKLTQHSIHALTDYSELKAFLKRKDALLTNSEKYLWKPSVQYYGELQKLTQQLKDLQGDTSKAKRLTAYIQDLEANLASS